MLQVTIDRIHDKLFTDKEKKELKKIEEEEALARMQSKKRSNDAKLSY